MARDGGYEIIPADVINVVPTKAMAIKNVQFKQQEARSKIARAKQDLEDLKAGAQLKVEYTILHAEAELKQLQTHEKRIMSSVDTQQSK